MNIDKHSRIHKKVINNFKVKGSVHLKATEKEGNHESITTEQKWQLGFDALEQNYICKNMFKSVEFCLCFPATSAPGERAFSIMNNIWNVERGSRSTDNETVQMICSEF